ncbi:N-acetylmuramoyl-L-alanine amidase [Actinomadura scrupuli]|uniref:N-acetylmuramoyl-L-alanine amidase n=1 Tax=Actinomadura scrupuli TaxID=559629 RepID=UPI003D9869A5
MGVALVATSLGALSACGDGPAKRVGGQVAVPPAVRATPVAAPAATPIATATARTTATPRDTGQSRDKPLSGKVIAIDPGHNGGNAAHPEIIAKPVYIITGEKECDTTGTETHAGYTEHAFTWDVSQRLKAILESRGAKVVLTRPNDTGVGPCINQRAAIANRAKADAALSVHADGAAESGHGFHIIEPAPIKGHTDKIAKPSARLALALRAAYHKGTQMPYSNYIGENALDVRGDLGGLNLSTVPKVFLETGNMQNPGDAAKLSDGKFRQRIAQSLADGFCAYFS